MRHEVSVSFTGTDRLDIAVDGTQLPTAEQARRWLDDEFVRQDCSPLRASGKVLTADKVLAVASAAGEDGFADATWRQAFANATCAALARPTVVVDLSAMTLDC